MCAIHCMNHSGTGEDEYKIISDLLAPWVIINISIASSVKNIWQCAVESCRHFFVFGAHQGKTIPYVIANWFSVNYYHKEMFRFHSRDIFNPWYQFIIKGIIVFNHAKAERKRPPHPEHAPPPPHVLRYQSIIQHYINTNTLYKYELGGSFTLPQHTRTHTARRSTHPKRVSPPHPTPTQSNIRFRY